jgi:C-terminal processing protease CtpA/Prc
MAYVGFSVQADGGEYAVANVTADTTADQEGLKQWYRISAIDGKTLQGMHEEEVKGGS